MRNNDIFLTTAELHLFTSQEYLCQPWLCFIIQSRNLITLLFHSVYKQTNLWVFVSTQTGCFWSLPSGVWLFSSSFVLCPSEMVQATLRTVATVWGSSSQTGLGFGLRVLLSRRPRGSSLTPFGQDKKTSSPHPRLPAPPLPTTPPSSSTSSCVHVSLLYLWSYFNLQNVKLYVFLLPIITSMFTEINVLILS